ncbi:MAG: SecD/SecF fusion protein [Parvicella sp.]|jgi:SecD/SecF fusion protein
MRNRSAIWVFTILLTLACLYQLSFSWVTGSIEKKAASSAEAKLDSIIQTGDDLVILGRDTITKKNGKWTESLETTIKSYYEAQYLARIADEPAYPVLGISYAKCKNQQLTQGLDLQGGMAVTLEISVAELVSSKAGYSETPSFVIPFENAQKRFAEGSSDGFIDLFFQEYEAADIADKEMNYFYMENEKEFPLSLSTEEIKAKLKEYASSSIGKAQTVIEDRVNRFGLGQIIVQADPVSGRLYIEIPGAKDRQGVRDMLQKQANLEFWRGYEQNLRASFTEIDRLNGGNTPVADEKVGEVAKPDAEILPADLLKYAAADFAFDSTSTLADTTNYSEMLSLREAEAKRVEDANITLNDPASVTLSDEGIFGGRFVFTQDQAGTVFSPKVGYANKIADTAAINLILAGAEAQVYVGDVKFMWSHKPTDRWAGDGKRSDIKKFVLYAAQAGEPELTGADVAEATYSTGQQGVVVNMSLKDETGAVTKWADWTTEGTGTYAGISMDGAIYSFPVINSPITGGNTQITGDFTLLEAENLSDILEAGALPAPAIIVDESMVGPTLGAENVSRSIWSFVFALIAVMAYMIFYYSKAGIIATVALVANIFFILGTLASLGAALTLPGIAGLVLTIGMAVDANVLIFERIREELRNGKGAKQAIADGYKHAYSAILDSNITSLLTAIILAYFGSGPIQGFATTLIIGIFASLFSSIFITRLLFSHMLDRKSNITFSIKPTENFLVGKNINFLGGRKKFYILSATIVTAGIISLFTMGISKSVEFTGGRTYKFEFESSPNIDELKTAISELSITADGKKVVPEIKTLDGNGAKLKITTNYKYAANTPQATAEVDAMLGEAFASLGFVDYELLEQRSVSPQISQGLIVKSVVAILLSLLAIFLYIGFRFNRWQFGLGALIAMFHDVLVVLGLFSILWKVMPFSMEIDQAFIAALLTVIGYSINDTVVVYDRIREFIGLHKRDDQNKVINGALNTTLTRTINTSATTFVVLLIIFIFGGEGIRGFSFALMLGVVVGTYSSIFIATPAVVDLTKDLMPTAKLAKDKNG